MIVAQQKAKARSALLTTVRYCAVPRAWRARGGLLAGSDALGPWRATRDARAAWDPHAAALQTRNFAKTSSSSASNKGSTKSRKAWTSRGKAMQRRGPPQSTAGRVPRLPAGIAEPTKTASGRPAAQKNVPAQTFTSSGEEKRDSRTPRQARSMQAQDKGGKPALEHLVTGEPHRAAPKRASRRDSREEAENERRPAIEEPKGKAVGHTSDFGGADEVVREVRANHAGGSPSSEPRLRTAGGSGSKKDPENEKDPDNPKTYMQVALRETDLVRQARKLVAPNTPGRKTLKEFMESRGMSLETADAFYIGLTPAHNELVFPQLSRPGALSKLGVREHFEEVFSKGGSELLDGTLVAQRIKFRGVKQKSFRQSQPGVTLPGLFGWHLVKPSDTEVVVTEGELDAMAVYHATKRAVVSLPNGAASSLSGDIIDALKRHFKMVYLWLDNDQVGQASREKHAQSFGLDTIRFVGRAGDKNKDANEVLLNGGDINAYIRDAKPAFEEPFDSVHDLKEVIRDFILHPAPLGDPFDCFPSLTGLVGGFRMGELTILTGPTGSGKTTLLSQLSLHLAHRGVRTLWGSFEIKREALLTNMLRQYIGSRGAPTRSHLAPESEFLTQEDLLAGLDEFGELPMYALKYFGATDVTDVLDSVTYSVSEAGMQHVIIDNLQFMVSGGGGVTSDTPMTAWDRFDSMDSAIGNFRQIATQKNCHITVVIHPRKEKEGTMLTLQSFSGTGKATQEADNVWILQKDKEGQKTLDVKKNRFQGVLGSFPLDFAFPSRSFLDLGAEAVEARSMALDLLRQAEQPEQESEQPRDEGENEQPRDA